MKTETLPVRYELGKLPAMSEQQALAYGKKHLLSADLKKAGFGVSIFRSDPEIHGAHFYRINIGKTVRH